MVKYNASNWKIVKKFDGCWFWQGFYNGDYHFTAYTQASADNQNNIRHELWQNGYPFAY